MLANFAHILSMSLEDKETNEDILLQLVPMFWSDPDLGLKTWIRIQPKNPDPTGSGFGSGSATLL